MTDLELYFQYKCRKGLSKRGLEGVKIYEDQLQYEINVITQAGFVGYFLIVADLINWARSKKIPIGPGRGSACGSLISYVLEITQLDPVKYKLVFERFINPCRLSKPDIDIDIAEEYREDVIKYVIDKYGSDKVAHIGTFGSMKAKAAIKDVARTLGYDYQTGDKLSRLTLEPIEGKPQPLSVCYEQVKELYNIRYGEKRPEQEILYWAEKVENRPKSFSTHASGVVIAPTKITDFSPLYIGKDGKPTTQFDMGIIEELGLIKFDFLGLRALSTIDKCLKGIKERLNKDIDILKIPLDDQETYKTLQSGNCIGIFQMESSAGIKDLVVKIQPKSLEDISLIIACYRPGPLSSPNFANYLKIRTGEASPTYLMPELEPILQETDSFLIYQEQCMEIAKQLAGYTLAEADILRKSIGKKNAEDMKKQQNKFISGMVNNGFDADKALTLFNEIAAFASYGFNKSHSLAYAFIAYQMAWLKTHYPLDHLCACLISDSDEEEKVIQYISYAKEKGITIKSPDINNSQYNFSISKDGCSILFGLGAIKHIGKPIENIIVERNKHGHYKSILDFAKRVDLNKINKKKLESLVLSGAFDDLGQNARSSMLAAINNILIEKDEIKRYESKLETYNRRLEKYNQRSNEINIWENLSAKEKLKTKKPHAIKCPEKPEIPKAAFIPELTEISFLDLLNHEKELLGYYISGHPLDVIKEQLDLNILTIKEFTENKTNISFIAIPSMINEFTTKKSKQKMADILLEDKTGTIPATVFSKTWANVKDKINTKTPILIIGSTEIVERDEGKLVKFLINDIQQLRSVAHQIQRDLHIKCLKKNIDNYKKLLLKYPGKDFNVKMDMIFNHSVISCQFECGGNKEELHQKLKEIEVKYA